MPGNASAASPGHARALERLGYKVTIEAIDSGTGEFLPVTTVR
jgi:hypothetical protein